MTLNTHRKSEAGIVFTVPAAERNKQKQKKGSKKEGAIFRDESNSSIFYAL